MHRADNSRIRLAVFAALAVLGAESWSHAGLLRVSSDTFFSRRTDDLQAPEALTYEFLNASYLSDARALEMNGNFSLSYDAFQNTKRFDLYLLDFSYEALPDLIKIHGGRSFDVFRSSRALSSDSLGVDFFLLEKRLSFGFFYGIERSLARGNFDASADLLGSYLNFRTDSILPWFFGGKYQVRQYVDKNKSVERTARFSVQKPFSGSFSPELLVDSEVLLDTSHVNTLESGVNLYPSLMTGLRIRALTYELSPFVGIEQPIYSIFSQGRLYEASAEVDHSFGSPFSMSFALAYDDFPLEASRRAQGQRYELGLRFSGELLSVRNAVYVLDSYGGNVLGDRFDIAYQFTDQLELNGGSEATYYEKITSSRRLALSSQVGITTELKKHLRFMLSSELNSNNSLQYDFRVNARLTYQLWGET